MTFITSVAAVVAACADASSTGTSTVTVRDSAGIEIIVNHTPAWEPGEEWRVTEEPLVRIGAVSGSDPAYQLSDVVGAVRLSDGRFVVLDRLVAEIRWFDATGRHLRTAGGEGEGPEEFLNPSELLKLEGDTVLVVDGRFEHAWFDAEGRLVRREVFSASFPSSAQEAYETLREYGLGHCYEGTLRDLSKLSCQIEPGRPIGASGPGRHRSMYRLVRIAPDFSKRDTLGLWGGIEQWVIDWQGGRMAYFSHPLSSWSYTASGGTPLQVASALNPVYSIELWDQDGRLHRVVRRSAGRRVATPRERRIADELAVAGWGRRDPSRAARALFEIEFPDSLPAVFGLWITEPGDLLVRRNPLWIEEDHPPVSYDVFNPKGRWLGEISLPPRFSLYEVGEDYILGSRTDDLGVPYVELYGLER